MAKTLFVRILMIGLIGAGLGACVAPHGYYRGGYYSGPPASVGYFSFWYYPGARVYYDVSRHVYFYPSNGGWVRVRQLPPPMKARLGHHVTIHSRHERPYLDYNTHRRDYPAKRYVPPVKKMPEQYRYQPPRDQYDNRRNERDYRRDDRQDNRRNERRDDRRNERSDVRRYSAPDKGTKHSSKTSAHDKGNGKSRNSDKSQRHDRNKKSDKSKRNDGNRYNDRSRDNNRNDQYQQYQEAPRKY